MRLIVEGERITLEFSVEGRIWSRGRGAWHFKRYNKELWLEIPVGYIAVGGDFFKVEQDEQPKYSRTKRLTITLEHGKIEGYKE